MAFAGVAVNGITPQSLDSAFLELEAACQAGMKPKVEPPCADTPPDASFTCSRQKKWGKCAEEWMKPFCRHTCYSCTIDPRVTVSTIVGDLGNLSSAPATPIAVGNGG